MSSYTCVSHVVGASLSQDSPFGQQTTTPGGARGAVRQAMPKGQQSDELGHGARPGAGQPT